MELPVRVFNEQQHEKRKEEIMEQCYACYAEHGLGNIGIKGLAAACGISSGSLYTYFPDLDSLIVASTAYCMSRVEDDFMARAPASAGDVMRFLDETPYWTARQHGKKYRLMYQVYSNPKYTEHGKRFFDGVNERYAAYARQLEPKIGIPHTIILSLIFVFVRACVHYALFEQENYLQSQIAVLKQAVALFAEKYSALPGGAPAVGAGAGQA